MKSLLRSFAPRLSLNIGSAFTTPTLSFTQLLLPRSQIISNSTKLELMPPTNSSKVSKNQRGGRRGGRPPYPGRQQAGSANDASNPKNPTQQRRRPTADDITTPEASTIMDPKRLYSTSAGAQTAKPFSSLGDTLDASLLEALNKMGFEYMSPVQQMVLTQLPSLSSDCLVQAKTGTGKTAAFLLPAIQNLLDGHRPPRGKVGILVICPTRELALQIAKECEDITACLPQKMQCHTAFGGTARASSLSKFMNGDPTILIATPGRLDDILGEEEVRDKFDNLKTVVLDEADRMLDQGFAPAILKILRRLPPKSDGWQGMAFSATLPPKVDDVVKCILFPGYTSLSTIDPNEAPTVDRIPQFAISVPTIGQTLAATLSLLEAEYKQAPDDFKVIVFGTTANGVGYLHDLYKAALPQFRVFEIHSRMSQPARTKTTENFKQASSGILFASDVVGRGMDFPNVSLVVQLGLPSSEEQYIHRVGRTARAGKDGRAVIILFQNEDFFVSVNKALPIKPYPLDIVANQATYQPQIDRANALVDEETKAKAYQAFLGYNKTFMKKLKLDSASLVRVANDYAAAMGCPEPPLIEKKTIGKMGLKGVPGLRIGSRRGAND